MKKKEQQAIKNAKFRIEMSEFEDRSKIRKLRERMPNYGYIDPDSVRREEMRLYYLQWVMGKQGINY